MRSKALLATLLCGTAALSLVGAAAAATSAEPGPTGGQAQSGGDAVPSVGAASQTTNSQGQSVSGHSVSGQGASGQGGVASSAASPTAAPTVTSESLGSNVVARFFKYQAAELGQTSSPIVDPNAPPSRTDGVPPQPEPSPPFPFTEWPYGGTTSLDVNRPSSVDSPLMVAIGETKFGHALNDAHIQVYGWVDVGANVSTNHVRGGNSPGAYDYIPNAIQLDQAVIYVERTPDTVQKDHVDWGFRISGIYGTDYRYTTAYGFDSNQLLNHNHNYGYDSPLLYAELYVPKVADGLLLRAGRFISLPDIEAQLAPNNYTYSHSLTYTFDNYTNEGIQATLAATKNLYLQFGVTIGSDTVITNAGAHLTNLFPNPLYPNGRYLKDPGAKPSYTGCLRYESNSAKDDIYLCADAINNGEYGYNNLQWYGVTYFHKFNDKWHLAFESYNLHQKDVPNINNPEVVNIIAQGGSPFSPQNVPFNAPNGAHCSDAATLKCTASAQSVLTYVNYQFAPLDNLTLRGEYYNDMQGQRTGVDTQYVEFTIGVQHWLSPQIELRPEIAYYDALDAKAFNGNSNYGIAPSRYQSLVISGDAILHF